MENQEKASIDLAFAKTGAGVSVALIALPVCFVAAGSVWLWLVHLYTLSTASIVCLGVIALLLTLAVSFLIAFRLREKKEWQVRFLKDFIRSQRREAVNQPARYQYFVSRRDLALALLREIDPGASVEIDPV